MKLQDAEFQMKKGWEKDWLRKEDEIALAASELSYNLPQGET